jgi:hypothetical protein
MTPSRALAAAALVLAGCSHASEAEPAATPAEVPAECAGFDVRAELVTDLSTGLVWDRFVELALHTHDEATAICAARGARLPTRAELLALRVTDAPDGCQLPACAFRGDRCAILQCGTSVPGVDAHWGVAFSGGSLVMVPGDGAQGLVCVR